MGAFQKTKREMPKSKSTKKFATMKKRILVNDHRLQSNIQKRREQEKPKDEDQKVVEIQGPPYYVLLDTNFINFSIQNKLEIVSAMMDCLYAKCIPVITDCVMGELEKMGRSHRLALKIAKDERFERLTCSHKGTYADNCLVERVTQHKCYIVATCDRDLKRRI